MTETKHQSINQACVDLSIDPSAFRRTLQAAIDLAYAKTALSAAIAADFESLRSEGLTDDEEQALKAALNFTIN